MTARLLAACALCVLAGCTRTITRIETVEVKVPVAVACPTDLPPRPTKPVAALPSDARQALAVAMQHMLALDVWVDGAAGAVAACNQKPAS